MAQSVEHILGKDEVIGSIPISSSIKRPSEKDGLFVCCDFQFQRTRAALCSALQSRFVCKLKNILRNFKKLLDKSETLWYNY